MSADFEEKDSRAVLRFRALFDAQPFCVAHISDQGIILDINQTGCDLLGYAREELIGEPMSRMVREKDAAESHDRFERLLRGEDLPSYQDVLVTKTGLELPMEITTTATVSARGEVVIQSIGRDLRDELETQKKLLAATRLFDVLMRSTVDLIVVKDQHGRFTRVNQAFLDITGRTESEVIGRTNIDLLGQEHGSVVAIEERQVLDQGVTVRSESTYMIAGNEVVLQFTKTPIRDETDEIIGLVGIARDISDERAVAQQIVDAQKMDAVGSLAGGVAHDFADYLTNIIGNLSTAQSKLAEGEDAAENIHAAYDAAEAASELTNRLLHLARDGSSARDAVDLAQIIHDLRSLLHTTFDKSLHVRIRVSPDLWPIDADASQIKNMIMHLCLNARDALRERHAQPEAVMDGTPWLEIAAENIELRPEFEANNHSHNRHGEFVKLTISDNGGGMTAEVKAQIFEPFFSTKGSSSRSGLGLSMVYAAVANHGGWIRVESEPGLGTDFIVFLPRGSADVVDDSAVSEQPTESEMKPDLTVLIIEDKEQIRAYYERVLVGEGYEVFSAGGGAAGWEILEAHGADIDLILLDLLMPEMSGKHFLEMMVQNDVSIPVLVCTGYPGDLARRELEHLGVADFLGKPFTPNRLRAKVRAVIDKHR